MLKRVKYSLPILLATNLLIAACDAQKPARQFQFEQYSTIVYGGPIKIPDGLYQDEQGGWRDENEKRITPPVVTFAGEYYLSAHSCGTGCRYYELSSLRTGADIGEISKFDAPEQRPVTSDGHPYLTLLYYKRDSRLLIAEYHLDFGDPVKQEACRQQYFVLDSGRLRAISKIFPFCTEERKERQ